jgi:formate dehydrogenase subunit gamma
VTPQDSLLELVERHRGEPVDVAAVLDDLVRRWGYVPERHLKAARQELGLSMSQVYKLVLAEPHRWPFDPPGKHHCKVCLGPNCGALNSAAILEAIESAFQLPADETTPDGKFSLQTVYCCGLCREARVIVIDNRHHTHQTPESAVQAVREALEE